MATEGQNELSFDGPLYGNKGIGWSRHLIRARPPLYAINKRSLTYRPKLAVKKRAAKVK